MQSQNKNENANNFLLGVGPNTSDSLIGHLKNIENQINQKIVGKNSTQQNYSTSENTFKELISKLEDQVSDLNNKIKNYNSEKQHIIELSKTEVSKLKSLIVEIYMVVRILTKSMELSNQNKNNLLEKLRKTIENSTGFLKSINEITSYKDKNNNNLTMSNVVGNININQIAKSIRESPSQINNNPTSTNEYIENKNSTGSANNTSNRRLSNGNLTKTSNGSLINNSNESSNKTSNGNLTKTSNESSNKTYNESSNKTSNENSNKTSNENSTKTSNGSSTNNSIQQRNLQTKIINSKISNQNAVNKLKTYK
jgi:hypothetical protein